MKKNHNKNTTLPPFLNDGVSSMFREDFGNDLTPYSWDNKEKEFQAKIIGQDLDQSIQLCKRIGRTSSTQEDAINEAIRMIGRGIAYSKNGYIEYQLVNQEEDIITKRDSTGLPIMPILFVITPLKHKLVNWLRSTHIWKIAIPPSLGGKRTYKKLIQGLEKYNKFGPNCCANPDQQLFYFPHYEPLINNYLYKITKDFGWNQRKENDITDFYYVYRDVKFKLARTILRNHIVNELNKLFKRLSIDAKIEFSATLSPETLQARLDELKDPNTNFQAFLKKYGY